MMNEGMGPADIAAVTNNNGGGFGWGGSGGWFWIVVLFLFAFSGWGGIGGLGGGGAQQNYVLASDFATIQRQLSDGFNSIDNALDRQNAGICDLGYAALGQTNQINTNIMQTGNALATQLADCCCKAQTAIAGVNYNMATQANGISREIERGFCDANYNNQAAHNATMVAIDKVGDRIIDYMAQSDAQKLRDENQALRLAASQNAQNNYLISQLRPCPRPAYITCNPWGNSAPYGGCGYAA